MQFRNIAVIFAVLMILLFAAASAFATTYKISGSSDGTGTFVVDDGLTVHLNGIQIYGDGNASSGARQPIQFNANVGDQLRFAVSNLVASALSGSEILMSWRDNANNEANFELERCDGKGKCKLFKLLASPSTNSVNYLDTGLTVATQYSYRIRATNEVGNSAYSNIAKAKTARR